MSINLNDRQLLLLSQFAYIKFDNYITVFDRWKDDGKTLSEIISYIDNANTDFIQNGSLGNNDYYGNVGTRDESNDELTDITVTTGSIFDQIRNDPVLGSLVLKDFVNNNGSGGNGLVAYCFANASGDTVFAFTGSEEKISLSSIDWADNLTLGLYDISGQFNDALSFVQNNIVANADVCVTGHSKGGANAMYIAACIDGVEGAAFDAPGISQCLNLSQNTRLSAYKNYVNQRDFVGSILEHSENRIFIKATPDCIATTGDGYGVPTPITPDSDHFYGHYTSAIAFDGFSVIQADRTVWTVAAEVLVSSLTSSVAEDAGLDIRLFGKQNTLNAGIEFFSLLGVEYSQVITFLTQANETIDDFMNNVSRIGDQFSEAHLNQIKEIGINYISTAVQIALYNDPADAAVAAADFFVDLLTEYRDVLIDAGATAFQVGISTLNTSINLISNALLTGTMIGEDLLNFVLEQGQFGLAELSTLSVPELISV